MNIQLDQHVRSARLHLRPISGGRFQIVDRHTAQPVGRISLRAARHSQAIGLELSYAVAPTSRGRGFCTEAALALVDYAFAESDLPRVHASSAWLNIPSRRVLASLGMHQRDTVQADRESLAGLIGPRDIDLMPYALVEYELARSDWLRGRRDVHLRLIS